MLIYSFSEKFILNFNDFLRLSLENFENSFVANSQSVSQTQNDWMSYSYNNESNNYQGTSNNNSSFRGLSHQTSPWKCSPSSSESSWSSNDMSGMSRWPSSASTSSMSSTQSTRTYWSGKSTRSNSIPSAPSSSRSNSFDEQNKRLFYASHSVFLDNLRSSSSDDSFNSEFNKFNVNKK